MPRFAVPKGDTDIRVVWDLAKNGLNKCMFTPSFFLPKMSTYLRRISAGTFCGDFDIGEQFHNYNLHPAEQIYCGVDIPKPLVQKLRLEGLSVDATMRWARLVFGWQSSPYFALRMLARAMELAKGNPSDKGSAFAWTHVEMNLPGMSRYDPSKPRVIKLTAAGEMATELIIYFDDGRVAGGSEKWHGKERGKSRPNASTLETRMQLERGAKSRNDPTPGLEEWRSQTKACVARLSRKRSGTKQRPF